MRRLGAMFVLFGLVAITATATAQEEPQFEPHPHVLLLGLELDGEGEPTGPPRKCVDLAGNRAVPLHAHHEHLHFGSSGVSFGGKSGNLVIPAAPFPAPVDDPVPWSNCEELLALFFGE